MWMRGGTSKGGFFVAEDLPADIAARDAFLLRAMGSPDSRQIDGMGGGDPLTSKVAIVSPSSHPDAHVDYLFLQVSVDQAIVSDAQNCGNMLAGVGHFAIERGLVAAQDGETEVVIHMLNTGQISVATVQTPDGIPSYTGAAHIDGVQGTASPVLLTFKDIAGSSCGAMLPTGHAVDVIDGIRATLIDMGMPTVVLRAEDLGITGYESRETLEANTALRDRLESIRLKAGVAMNLGDVTDKTVPKMSMVAPARFGGTISTRTFIPHRCHASIGVLGAVSVGTACMLADTPAGTMSGEIPGKRKTLSIEHPIGETTIVLDLDDDGAINRAAVLRTTRKLFDGVLFADSSTGERQ